MTYITEEEARLKWCPMVRNEDADTGVASNCFGIDEREKRNPNYSRCIASICMLWRWKIDDEVDAGCCGLVNRGQYA